MFAQQNREFSIPAIVKIGASKLALSLLLPDLLRGPG
jgi:hypothetical protein